MRGKVVRIRFLAHRRIQSRNQGSVAASARFGDGGPTCRASRAATKAAAAAAGSAAALTAEADERERNQAATLFWNHLAAESMMVKTWRRGRPRISLECRTEISKPTEALLSHNLGPRREPVFGLIL